MIPEPVALTKTKGVFVLPKNVVVQAADSLLPVVNALKSRLTPSTGATVTTGKGTAAIRLVINTPNKTMLGKEGYQLSVQPSQVVISANTAAGLFYGVQSFLQLLPKEVESTKPVNNVVWQAPCVEVTDYPRFAWRGLMFDVARHFFTKEEVKRFIDDMVKYKFNLLHFHLTDDEGWRIEIKSLPRLTEVGAWRVNKTGYFGTFSKPLPNEPKDYGGFYTQDDIKELVQYAKERYVNILPEIDVPGHSLAAVVAYPDLSCTPEANTYGVRAGEAIMDWSRGAPPIALLDNTLCPANEKVYDFMEKVVTEVAQLFPFDYIHLGGDEAPHNYWQKTPAIQELMQKENLKTMEQVQSYFTRRVEKIVQGKGKKLMGWDEIVEGGVNPSTAIMSWRGVKQGIEASKAGHEVVMSPTTYAYLDYMQADVVMEPRVYATLRLSKAYEFDPAPEGANARMIKGGQANLWTEQIYNLRTAQYMVWPRALAISESVWSQREKKNWNRFFNRVEQHFPRLDQAQTKYARAVYDPIFTVSKKDSMLVVKLDKEVADLDLYYTVDNSFPDAFSPRYTQPIVMPKDAAMLRVISYRGNTAIGRMHTMTVEEMNRRVPKK